MTIDLSYMDLLKNELRNPAHSKKCRHFLLEGLIQNGRQLNLNFEPEQLESSISTPFPLSQPLGLWNWHECDAKIPFRPNYPRWPPSTSWKVNVWTRAPTIRHIYTFPLNQPWRFRFWHYIYGLVSLWPCYQGGVKRIKKTSCLIQIGHHQHFWKLNVKPEQLESSISRLCSRRRLPSMVCGYLTNSTKNVEPEQLESSISTLCSRKRLPAMVCGYLTNSTKNVKPEQLESSIGTLCSRKRLPAMVCGYLTNSTKNVEPRTVY